MAKQKQTEAEKTVELKKPAGKQIAMFKDRARQALPSGSLEELADKANELVRAAGFDYTYTPEKMAPKAEGEPGPRKRRGEEEAPREATVTHLVIVAQAGKEMEGGIPELISRLKEVTELAEKVGGLANLNRCLETLGTLLGQNGD